jgi:hypothetical protein
MFSPLVDHYIDDHRNDEYQHIIGPREGVHLVGIGYTAATLVDLLFMLHDSALYFLSIPHRRCSRRSTGAVT